MACRKCGRKIDDGERFCRDCASSNPPLGIRIYVALAFTYWIFPLFFWYGVSDRQPIIGGFASVFAVAGLLSLPGVWRLTWKHWGASVLTYGLWLVGGVPTVLFHSALPLESLVWFVPVPVFLTYIYSRHRLFDTNETGPATESTPE